MSVAPVVKNWLDRLYYMARATVITISTKEAQELYNALSDLSAEKEALAARVVALEAAPKQGKRK